MKLSCAFRLASLFVFIAAVFAAEVDPQTSLRRLFISFSGREDNTQATTTSQSTRSEGYGCPEACSTCRAGKQFGGEELVNGVCIHYCSMSRYCGSSMVYRKTDCSACAQSGMLEPEPHVQPVQPVQPVDPAPPASGCSDVPGFIDKDGRSCEVWKGYDCRNHYGWSQEEVDRLLTACGISCNSCGYVPIPRVSTPTPQEAHEDKTQNAVVSTASTCPDRCQTCRDGKRLGGVELVNGVCTQHCSIAGYCGKNMMFRKTNCSPCAEFQENVLPSDAEVAGSGHEEPTQELVHDCPNRCQTCKPGKRFGGKDLVGGICTYQCSWTGHCGTGVMYKRTNCESCATYAHDFEGDVLLSSSAVVTYSFPLLLLLIAVN